jgi:hypothetical protein
MVKVVCATISMLGFFVIVRRRLAITRTVVTMASCVDVLATIRCALVA